MAIATNIASWGNSEAVRIPKGLLRSVGLSTGDKVRLNTTDHGSIEIIPVVSKHRCVQPKRGISFETLFEGYQPYEEAKASSLKIAQFNASSAWPTEDMVGAEAEAWGEAEVGAKAEAWGTAEACEKAESRGEA